MKIQIKKTRNQCGRDWFKIVDPAIAEAMTKLGLYKKSISPVVYYGLQDIGFVEWEIIE